VFTARYVLSLYIKQIPLMLKGFIAPICSESMYSFIKTIKYTIGNTEYTKNSGTRGSPSIETLSTLCGQTYEMLGNVMQQTKRT